MTHENIDIIMTMPYSSEESKKKIHTNRKRDVAKLSSLLFSCFVISARGKHKIQRINLSSYQQEQVM